MKPAILWLHAVTCAAFAVLVLRANPLKAVEGLGLAVAFVGLALCFAIAPWRLSWAPLLRVLAWLQAGLLAVGVLLLLLAATIGGGFNLSPELQTPAWLAGVMVFSSALSAWALSPSKPAE
ncbi:hypothetical protein SAMN05216214_10552 [Atopomonas hussainii]|uniref:Uncharacterized protein n=1 Tax=Atopomonas hussainii TaxID=1429083 RepID=A0A1H7JWT0_9GAMM|nr:hypothetical protein [Atopomonas hussainii]SEK78227.1 hypothetical protein SAMN05216214_10552 [Atopomonas hussainii]